MSKIAYHYLMLNFRNPKFSPLQSRKSILPLFYLLIFQVLSAPLFGQFYNGTQTDFGKNRVQYRDFEWQFYRFKNFETYFYTGGKELAVHTAKYANVRIKEIEKKIDYYLEDRVQFIIYNKQSDFRQSNVGLSSDETNNIGGVSNIVGSKVFLYFDGDYAAFNQQIDKGIYKVLIYQLIYGGNWREVLRNSALLHLPSWYMDGLISYLANPNDPLLNAQLKDGIENDEYNRFNALTDQEALVAGHFIWKYIAETYGENVISNILYMTRLSRNIDDGFLYILGISFEDLYEDWLIKQKAGTKKELASSQQNAVKIEGVKMRKNRVYQEFKTDPSGRSISYSTNKLGQTKIYVYDTQNDKKKKIFKTDLQLQRIQDYSYPILLWHPSGKILNFIIEKKGEVLFYTYQIEEKELSVKPIFKIDKVLSADYAQDGKKIIFSGVTKGQSDLFLYNVIGNTQEQLTNDQYDDLKPIFNLKETGVYFSSNRLNDSLNLPHKINDFAVEKDIFFYDFDSNEIQEASNTENKNEISPLMADKQLYFKTLDQGNYHLYKADFDSSVAYIDTSIHYDYYYKTEKLDAEFAKTAEISGNKNSDQLNLIRFADGRYQLAKQNLYFQDKQEFQQDKTGAVKEERDAANVDPVISSFKKFPLAKTEENFNINNYSFIGEINQEEREKEELITYSPSEIPELNFPTQRLYRLNFKPDNSVLQLNNSFINGQYQLYNGGPFTNPGLGVSTKIGIVDLMEDHRIYGGLRLSGDITEYSLNYQNLSKRLDKEYSISRRKQRSTATFFPYDIKTITASASLIWPFNEVASLRGTFSARNDKVIFLSSDINSLRIPTFNEYWASWKLAYVFDNTQSIALNIRYGTRYKVFFEQYQLAYSEQENTPSSDLSVVGFDFRHYQKVHKEIIVVSRLAGSTSFGSNPLVYYLGGVDEWWKSDLFDENTPIDNSQNYGFQALAANMRGFLQNVRNGNSFAVMNNEIRIPVFAYLINRPIQSNFVRNFQFIGFGDIGTAWVGTSPFAKDNPFSNEVKTTGPITVTYENINNPIVGGIGGGLRTTLLGYFVRADWGWGIENGVISKEPLFMFSLSLDI